MIKGIHRADTLLIYRGRMPIFDVSEAEFNVLVLLSRQADKTPTLNDWTLAGYPVEEYTVLLANLYYLLVLEPKNWIQALADANQKS